MGGYDKFCEKLNYAFEQAAPQDFVFGYGQGYVSYANQPGCSNAHVFSWGGKPWLTQYWVRRVNEQAYGGTTPTGVWRARRRPGTNGRRERTDVDRVVQYAGHGRCPPRIRDHLAGLRRGVDPSRQALLPGPTVPTGSSSAPTAIRTRTVISNAHASTAGCSTTSGSLTKNSHAAACSSYGWGPSPTLAGEPGNSPNSGRHIPPSAAHPDNGCAVTFSSAPPERSREKPEGAGKNRKETGKKEEPETVRVLQCQKCRTTPREPAGGTVVRWHGGTVADGKQRVAGQRRIAGGR